MATLGSRPTMKRIWLYSILLVLALFLTSCVENGTSSLYRVTEVIDGDTIKIVYNGGEVSVRYVGIDTPEIHESSKPIGEFGEQAKDYNEQLISASNWKVRIEDRGYDYYGRLLAYLYTVDGEMINEELVRNGLARPLIYDNAADHAQDFKDAYYEAYENRRGIFSKYDSAPVVSASIVKENLTPFYEGGYLGKIIWLEFKATYAHEYDNEYVLGSSDALVELRKEEADLFFDGNPRFDRYVGKTVKVYGEIWKGSDGRPKILLRAPFEIETEGG